jgi:hypothetical protein
VTYPPRRDRSTLSERSVAAGIGVGAAPSQRADPSRDPAPAPLERDAAAGSGPPAHCWVDIPGMPRRPGLLLRWDRTPEGGWSGLVVTVAPYDGEPAVMLVWLPAVQLRPVN